MARWKTAIALVVLLAAGSARASDVSTPYSTQGPQSGVSSPDALNNPNTGVSDNLATCKTAPSGGTDDDATLSGYTGTTFGSTLATNAITSPFCRVTAAQVTEDTSATATHWVQKTITFSETATSYTYTFWVKRTIGTRNALPFVFNSGSTANIAAGVDLALCAQNVAPAVTGGFFSAPTLTVTNAGSGWCKVALAFTGAVDTAIIVGIGLMVGTGATGVYTGDGKSSIAGWGSDFRAGAGP